MLSSIVVVLLKFWDIHHTQASRTWPCLTTFTGLGVLFAITHVISLAILMWGTHIIHQLLTSMTIHFTHTHPHALCRHSPIPTWRPIQPRPCSFLHQLLMPLTCQPDGVHRALPSLLSKMLITRYEHTSYSIAMTAYSTVTGASIEPLSEHRLRRCMFT